MKTMVFEPDPSGHRLYFVRLIAEALVSLGHDVLLVTSRRAPSTVTWREYVEPIASSVAVVTVDLPVDPSPVRFAIEQSRCLTECVSRLTPDHVYLPYGDGLSQIAALSPSLRWALHRRATTVEALILRARFAYPADGIKGRTTRAASALSVKHSPWTLVHYLDPLAVESAYWLNATTRGLCLMPEPVEQLEPVPREDARSALGLKRDGHWIVLAGGIDERKGASSLLKAFRQASLPGNTRLALAGKVNAELRQTIWRDHRSELANGSLVIRDRFLSSKEFWLALCAADLIALPYPSHIGSSGILARAAYLGRPVIASSFGWVGEATRRHRLGTTVDVSNPSLFGASLRAAVESAASYAADEASAGYVAFNTPKNFQERWTRLIRSRT